MNPHWLGWKKEYDIDKNKKKMSKDNDDNDNNHNNAKSQSGPQQQGQPPSMGTYKMRKHRGPGKET